MNQAPFYILRNMATFREAVIEKKHVTIGFIGGSITDPRGRMRWSEYVVSNLIAEFPEVAVDVENVAIGATGSDYAVFRAQHDLICRDCDIIFIEYGVNDNDMDKSLRNASREGLIRKLICGTKADLVLTYTYCAQMLQPMLEGALPDSIEEFERMAEYYGISSVFMSHYALHEVLRGTLRWEEWLPDGLHPANSGSRYYAEPVIALLHEALEKQNGKPLCRTRPPMFPNNWERAERLSLANVERIGYWRLYRCLDLPLVQTVLATNCVGSSVRFSFEGTGFVLTLNFGWMATDYRWRIDGGPWIVEQYDRPDWMQNMGWLYTKTLARGLEHTLHIVELEACPPTNDGKHKGTAFEICCIGILKD